ncbi:MAG: hypothetical protein HQK72_06065 [Desulfamplus sp.]|nr:hypothetical protein [Desulfamplus sp.]
MFRLNQINCEKRVRVITLFSIFVLFTIPALLFCNRTIKAEEADSKNISLHNNISLHINKPLGNLSPINALPPNAKQVKIGLYGVNIYDLSIRSNTYHITAYIWLKWKGDFDPVQSLEFTNLVENWSLTKKLLMDSPKIMPDGSKYQTITIEGRFFQPFDLRSYPLDKQKLELFIENPLFNYEDVVFIPDGTDSGYDAGLLIPGWKIKGLDADSYLHDYGTNFGETGAAVSKYSLVKFSFALERHINFFIWKVMLPLFIVLMTNWVALILKPILIEVRTAMPATALLTTVLMQQAALDAIPECSTLVLIDKIYVLAYIFIILTLFQIIWVNIHIDKNSPSSIARMVKIDKVSFGVQAVGFIISITLLLWLHH